MELGIVWPPTFGSSWLECHPVQIFAQLEPSFPPFGNLSQLSPSCFVIVMWLRGRIQTIEWFLATWRYRLATRRCKFWFCNLARVGLSWEYRLARALEVKASKHESQSEWRLQSWPKLCGTSLQNALPRPSISFSHAKQTFFGPNPTFPPSPHAMLFVRKGLPTRRPTLHRGGRGERRSEYCSNSGKRHFVPHILARIVDRHCNIFSSSLCAAYTVFCPLWLRRSPAWCQLRAPLDRESKHGMPWTQTCRDKTLRTHQMCR